MNPKFLARKSRGVFGLTSASLICVSLAWLPGCASHKVEVRQYGLMHEALGGGPTAESSVELAQVMARPHAHGVGALAGLAGEITIVDGKAWIARAHGGKLTLDGPTSAPDDGAAFLTVAYVEQWRDVRIERPLEGVVLENFIADQARRFGLDVTQPIPFIIDGNTADLQAHVINGVCPMKPGVRLTSDTQPWRYETTSSTQARIVGFFALDSVGRMTHPGTKLHAHVIFELEGQPITAHVERLAVAANGVLWLPDLR